MRSEWTHAAPHSRGCLPHKSKHVGRAHRRTIHHCKQGPRTPRHPKALPTPQLPPGTQRLPSAWRRQTGPAGESARRPATNHQRDARARHTRVLDRHHLDDHHFIAPSVVTRRNPINIRQGDTGCRVENTALDPTHFPPPEEKVMSNPQHRPSKPPSARMPLKRFEGDEPAQQKRGHPSGKGALTRRAILPPHLLQLLGQAEVAPVNEEIVTRLGRAMGAERRDVVSDSRRRQDLTHMPRPDRPVLAHEFSEHAE
ncbi:MAG: hypothetical protein SGPRY_012989, partial [Prymnesium sp.]